MIDFDSFDKIFPGRFVKKLKESIVPFDSPIERGKILKELYGEIKTFSYHPSSPRGYIILNKHNYVARIIPTFTAKDYFLYYLCCKVLEDEIAENRVEGTYGGWRLGNKIRFKEEEEEYALDVGVYIANNSFDPFLWMKNWQDFQKKAYKYSTTGEYKYIIKFDIANFYNSINLSSLERKVYLVAPKQKRRFVELLFHFLNNWNKKFEGYAHKVVGLPQDEISDCSRILANFYLQDFDDFMKELCDSKSSKYLRYADDQIIYTDDQFTARQIMFEAAKYLFRLGLDINSSKVREFDSMEMFNQYWAFEIFELLSDVDNKEKLNAGVKMFLDWKSNEINFRDYSVLKRILNIDLKLIEPTIRDGIISFLFEDEFLSSMEHWTMKKTLDNLSIEERKYFLNRLDVLINKVNFNSFHYHLRMFYEKNKIHYDAERLNMIIDELNL